VRNTQDKKRAGNIEEKRHEEIQPTITAITTQQQQQQLTEKRYNLAKWQWLKN